MQRAMTRASMLAVLCLVAAVGGCAAETSEGDEDALGTSSDELPGDLHYFQGESMATASGWNQTIGEWFASGGQTRAMWTNGTIFKNWWNPSSGYRRYRVASRGTYCNGGWPRMNFWVVQPDGRREGVTVYPITNYLEPGPSYYLQYAGTFYMHRGSTQFAVEFPNDAWGGPGGCDRNLFIDYVAIREL